MFFCCYSIPKKYKNNILYLEWTTELSSLSSKQIIIVKPPYFTSTYPPITPIYSGKTRWQPMISITIELEFKNNNSHFIFHNSPLVHQNSNYHLPSILHKTVSLYYLFYQPLFFVLYSLYN